jgi:glycosyltransferase involved in cell wall biosynthesis
MHTSISFVIPAYNCAKTLEESVDSIMKTNFHNGDELIIVNDGSTDDTSRVIERLKETYKHIIVKVNANNYGCPRTRNIGISIAKNSLIFCLDSDDILERYSVIKLKDFLTHNNVDVAAFQEARFFIDDIKKPTHKWVCKNGRIRLADYLAGPIVPGGNCLFTKKSWERIGGYWEYGKGLHEFWGFGLKQIASGSKLYTIPGTYYFHRHGKDSLYTRESGKEYQSSIVATKILRHIQDQIHPIDAKEIFYENGKSNWYERFIHNKRPIRLKSGIVGITGKIVIFNRSNIFIKISRAFQSWFYKLYKIKRSILSNQ